MPIQELTNASIYYEKTDFSAPWQAARPALLLIHGLNSSHAHWFNQVPLFSRDRTVVTVDLRGHGASSAPATGFTAGHHASDLVELLDRLEIDSVIPIGASLGGCIAQQLAVKIPGKVKAMVAVGSCAQVPKELNREDSVKVIQEMGLKNFLSASLPEITFSPGVDPGLIKFALDIAVAADEDVIMRRTLEGLVYDDLDAARAVSCPSLIVVGENDKTTPRYCSEQLRELIKNSSMAMVADCGHLPHLEAPETFNAILERFLKSLN